MLSLAPVSAHQGQTYYAQENYYTQNRTVENSQWQGIGAQRLGLRGNIAAREFQTLLEGFAPRSKQKLNGDGDTSAAEHRAGIDLTFSAPKSVSLAAFVGHDERLEVAHRQAVEFALNLAEQRYSQTRTGNNNFRTTETAGNLIVAKFHHDTSRAKDPQMHTHCVVINAVQRADGNWRSLHNEALYQNSKFLGLVYQNELASRVQCLGYQVEIRNNGTFEIAGYSEEHLEKFSKRREQLEELGVENQKQARSAVTKNRPKKGPEIPREELNRVWQKEATEVGLVHPNPRQMLSVQKAQEIVSEREILRRATSHASERDVSFRREQVESFALESQLGRLNWGKFQVAVQNAQLRGDIMRNAEKLWTTDASLSTEKTILNVLNQGRDAIDPIRLNSQEHVQKIFPELSKGQADAVLLTLQSRDQFMAWQGVAGAGKTYAMNVVRELTQDAKISIRGFAPSAEAAKVLQVESGIPAQTVAACLVESQSRKGVREGELWIVDEAGLLSARDCQALMLKAQEQKARVVFVGDTRQLSAVEAGNPFRLMQNYGISTAELSESRRQKNAELKRSVDLISDGQTKESIEAIVGQVFELRREETRARFISKEFITLDREKRLRTMILAGTNREREVITKHIRTLLKSEGSLGESMTTTRLKSKDLTREEMMNVAKFTVGDQLFFHKDRRRAGIQKNEHLEVVGVDDCRGQIELKNQFGAVRSIVPSEHKDSFLIFERREIEVAQGDRLKWTKNNHKLDIRNGEECIVAAIDDSKIRLQKSDGKMIEHGLKEPLHIDHNYVHTVFASQGKTCDRVFISVDKTFGQEAMYVALSRARFEAKIITPDKEQMLETISQSRAKLSALEVVPEHLLSMENGQEIVHQNQRQRSLK